MLNLNLKKVMSKEKRYQISYVKDGEFICDFVFYATSLKSAKCYASLHKRLNKFKCRTIVSLIK